jgi:beta-lactamase regulating signal transducer with metallopeptidase domain
MQLVSHSVFLKTLGWALFNSLWQMALVWVLYLLIIKAGKKISAKIKHGLAIFCLAAGATLSFISFFYFYLTVMQSGPATTDEAMAGGPFMPFDKDSGFFDKYLPYCSIIYLGVLLFQFIRYTKYYLHSSRLRLTGLKKVQPSLRMFVEETARRLGIRKKVGIWISSLAESPMTLGFLKSVILIPIATLNQLSTRQVEAILLHELAHIKRNDYFLNLLVSITGILFFFNPFSRALIDCIRKEAENSCDDLVMQFRYDPHLYISALLSLEKTRSQGHLAMAAIGKSNQVLLERVKRITGHKNPSRMNRPKFLIFLSLAITTYFSASYHPQHSVSQLAVPPVFSMAVTEIKPLSFQIASITVPEKITKSKSATKTCKPISRQKLICVEQQNENDLVLEGNDDGDKNDVSLAIQPAEEKYYSISQDEESPRPPVEETAGQFPFVPNSSFTYKITVDTLNQIQRRKYYDQRLATEADQKLRVAVEAIDWKKINLTIRAKGKKLTVKMLKDALYKSLAKPEIQLIQDQAQEVLDEGDEQRIRGDIQLELKALQNNKSKSPQEIQRIQQQLIRQQTKLHQQNIQKQREVLRNIEDEIRKKSKIVYI